MSPTEDLIKEYHPHCSHLHCDKPLGFAEEEAAWAVGDAWLCPEHHRKYMEEMKKIEEIEDDLVIPVPRWYPYSRRKPWGDQLYTTPDFSE
mgnify:CR=1 FL=1